MSKQAILNDTEFLNAIIYKSHQAKIARFINSVGQIRVRKHKTTGNIDQMLITIKGDDQEIKWIDIDSSNYDVKSYDVEDISIDMWKMILNQITLNNTIPLCSDPLDEQYKRARESGMILVMTHNMLPMF